MLSDLDISGGQSPLKCPPFPPAAKTLAVLTSLRYIRLVYSGGFHGEER
jgi:hypothetical protein